jgi:hypothetical protein
MNPLSSAPACVLHLAHNKVRHGEKNENSVLLKKYLVEKMFLELEKLYRVKLPDCNTVETERISRQKEILKRLCLK